jgi:hypothetical protein
MEWRINWRRGETERKTALVQLSDERMILLIQVSSMMSEPYNPSHFHSTYAERAEFPQKVKVCACSFRGRYLSSHYRKPSSHPKSSSLEPIFAVIHFPDITVASKSSSFIDDGHKLYRDFGIRAQNLVELGALARHVDPPFAAIHKKPLIGLDDVVAHYTHKWLKKGKERTSNWEAVLNGYMIDCQLLFLAFGSGICADSNFGGSFWSLPKDAANDVHCALTVHKAIAAIADHNGITLSPGAYTSNITGSAKTASNPTSTLEVPVANGLSERPSPQYLRAYKMWHLHNKPLDAMCAELTSRGEPLKESTVM